VSGALVGGWEYVWLAYGTTLVVLGGYALSIFIRYRVEMKRHERQTRHPGEEGR